MAPQGFLRGLLSFGILAAPNGSSRWQVPGKHDRTYARGHEWASVCTTCRPPKIVGDLKSHKIRTECLPGHVVEDVQLKYCQKCHKVLVYAPPVPWQHTFLAHEPTPTLMGRQRSTAAKFKPGR